MAKQMFRIWQRKKNSKAPPPKGIFINKNSVGTIILDNKVYTYNPHLVKSNRIDFEKDDLLRPFSNPSKKRIYIRKK